MKTDKIVARIGLFIVAIIWGSGFAASALALKYFSTYQILAIRFTIAFITSFIIFGKKIINNGFKGIKEGAIIGIFLFLAFLFQTMGLNYTSASKNAFLTAVNIVIVPFLGYIVLKNKINKNEIIGAITTLLGIGLLSFSGSKVSALNKGDLLTIVCAFFFAMQIFYTDHYVENISPGTIMVGQMGMATILSWALVVIRQDFDFNVNFNNIKPVLYLGLISTMLAFFIQTYCQKRLSSTEVAVILSTEALFGTLASIVILNEEVSIILLLAGLLILLGVVTVQYNPKDLKDI